MDVTRDTTQDAALGTLTDLTSNIQNPRYRLRQAILPRGQAHWVRVEAGSLSIVVTEGTLKVTQPIHAPAIEQEISREEGIHLLVGSCLKIEATSQKCTFMIAGTAKSQLKAIADSDANPTYQGFALSDYCVIKPWGWERWYTQGIRDDLPYSLKLIALKKGTQSSLQSHVQKSETNFVIAGRIDLLHGMQAPSDTTAKVDVSKLTKSQYTPGKGWSNPIGELHRLIALEDSRCVEISTPELDDVIRWQDDAQRPNGRIDSEHAARVARPARSK